MNKAEKKIFLQCIIAIILASLSTFAYIYSTRFSILYPSPSATIGFMPSDFLVLILLSVLYFRFISSTKGLHIGFALVSVIIGLSSLVLMDEYKYPAEKNIFYTLVNFPLIFILLLLGLAIMYYIGLVYLDSIIIKNIDKDTKTQSIKPSRLSLILLLISLPFYIALFPGSIRFEAGLTIGMISGEYILQYIAPPFWMGFVSIFYYIGKFLHSDTLGLVLYFLFVAFATCYALALIIQRISRLNINKWILRFSCVFIGFNPFIILKMYTMKYDALLAIAMLYFAIIIYDIANEGISYINTKNMLLLAISVFSVCAFRNVGLLIAVLSSIALVIYSFKHFAKRAFYILLSLLIGIGIFSTSSFFIDKAQNAKRCFTLGSYSIPLQQMGYTLQKHGTDALNKDEREKLSSITNPESIANSYKQNIVDPILVNMEAHWYDRELTDTDRSNIMKVWLSLGKRYPIDYLKAFVLNTYRYIAPGFYDDYSLFSSFYHQATAMDKLPNSFKPIHHSKTHQKHLEEFKYIAGYTSIYGVYMSCGYILLSAWIIFAIILRNKGNVLAMLPSFIYSLGSIFSPVNALVRYLTPVGFALPIALLLLLSSYKGKKYVER